jgi:hypothetical protein
MLRLHTYILLSMSKFFHIKSQHYILCKIYIYLYKGTGTHTVVCTAHLYSAKHTVVFIWSSWGVKSHATLSLFSLFFSKIYLTKSFSNVKIAFLYILWSMLKFFHIKSQHYSLTERRKTKSRQRKKSLFKIH